MDRYQDDEARLIAKLQKIEALFARPSTDGERRAAEEARGRLNKRLVDLARAERDVEMRFGFPETWSMTLFIAIARKHGLRPFRYSRQRRTTVMLRAKRSLIEETLWPEFQQCQDALYEHFDAVTSRVMARALGQTDPSVEQREGGTPEID